ncbi:MAG: GGDEF domain-containing protein [Gemmatimonadota bacterium]
MKSVALRRDINLPLAATVVFYTIAFAGVLIPSYASTEGHLRTTWLLFIITTALYAVLTVLVLYRQPEDLRARLFMFFGFAISMSLLGNKLNVLIKYELLEPTFFNLVYLFIYCAIYLINSIAILHLAAFIPREAPIIRSRPRLVYYPYAIAAALAVIAYVVMVNAVTPILPWSWDVRDAFLFRIRLTAVIYVAVGVGSLLLLGHAARHEPNARRRRQVLIVFFALLPWTVNTVSYIVAPGHVDFPGRWIFDAIILLLVPLAMFVAIVAYRLFEISAFVRKALVVAFAVAIILSALYAAMSIVNASSQQWFGVRVGLLGMTVLIFIAGGFLRPLVRSITTAVDHYFFHEKLELERMRREIISELAEFATIEEMAVHLSMRIRAALDLEYARMLVRDASGDFYRHAGSAGALRDDDAMPANIIPVAELGVSSAEPTAMSSGATRVLPIRLKDRVIGAMILGPSKSAWEPERDDLEVLDAILRQSAAMLENARLFDLATHDPLTGLSSRRVAEERLELEVTRSRRVFRPFAVALADIDDFKRINDEWGHHIGDIALRAVATSLAQNCRKLDLVARYGGEEFVLVMPETPPEGAHAHAADLCRIVSSLSIPADAGAEIRLTISIGVCAVGDTTRLADPIELIRRADEALYSAKRLGKNRVESYGVEKVIG